VPLLDLSGIGKTFPGVRLDLFLAAVLHGITYWYMARDTIHGFPIGIPRVPQRIFPWHSGADLSYAGVSRR
jgi:hypothetical protein